MNDRMYEILQTTSYDHLGIKERLFFDKISSIANLSMNWSNRLPLWNGLISMKNCLKSKPVLAMVLYSERPQLSTSSIYTSTPQILKLVAY